MHRKHHGAQTQADASDGDGDGDGINNKQAATRRRNRAWLEARSLTHNRHI